MDKLNIYVIESVFVFLFLCFLSYKFFSILFNI